MKTVEIAPPSSREETLAVIRLSVAIVGAAWLYFAQLTPAAGGARAGDLAPFQKRFGELPAPEQRRVRELQEGLIEAENTRGSAGRWPEVAALAAQGIPPFAADPTAPGHLAWTKEQQGLQIEYLGAPGAAGETAYLLQITEPDPQAPPHAATPVDEEHHRLPDGTLLHVATWLRRGGVAQAPAGVPAAAGWTQIVVGRDSSAAPPSSPSSNP